MRYSNPTPLQRDDVIGSSGVDDIHTFSGNDIVHGEGGNDLIDGGLGDDDLFGGGDNDIVIGGDGDDTIFGDDGFDTLGGGDGNDEIHGGTKNDRITGGGGTDNLFGDTGDDTFIQHEAFGDDFIDGGSFFVDTVDYNSTDARFSVKFSFGAFGFDGKAVMALERTLPNMPSSPIFEFATEWTNTVRSIERVITGNMNDTITGNEERNIMVANGGDDILRGNGGVDDMDGGAGNDVFVYDAFEDSLLTPQDSFGGSLPKGDIIRNFGDTSGNQDIIDLNRVDANRQLFAIGNEDFRADDKDGRIEAGELVILQQFDPSQNRVVSMAVADTGGDGRFDFQIRFDRAIDTLDVSDFIL
jgi:Ca2+-binding RTX toxin-like protein